VERSAWGEAKAAPGSTSTTPIGFQGQYLDEETGLAFNRFRYYDPDSGRYISADPIGLWGGLNPFSYAENRPRHLVDPEGLASKKSTIYDANGKPVASGESPFPGATDPAIKEAVDNAHKKFGAPDGIPANLKPSSAGQCAEIAALDNMAKKIRKEKGFKDTPEDNAKLRAELQKRVKAGQMITQQDGKNVNPCAFCGQVLRELGLHPANVGDVGKKNGVIGADGKAWDGTGYRKGKATNKVTPTAKSTTPPFAGT
jgi:RHS repeat-associated protein